MTALITTAKIDAIKVPKVSGKTTILNVAEKQVDLVIRELSKFDYIETEEKKDEAMEKMKLANNISKAIESKRKGIVSPYNSYVKEVNGYGNGLITKLDNKIAAIKQAVLAYQKDKEKKELEKRTNERQTVLCDLGFLYNGDSDSYTIEGIGSMSGTELKLYDEKSFTSIIGGFTEAIKRKAETVVATLEEEKDLLEMFGDKDQIVEHEKKIEKAATPIAHVASFGSFGGGGGSSSSSSLKGLTKRWTFEVTDANLVPREYLQVNETAIRTAVQSGTRTIAGVRIFENESLTLR